MVSWFRATKRSMPSREDIEGLIGDADAVEEMAAPDAGLVVLDEQDPAPLAHQDPGQETRDGVDSLARGAADHDVQV